MAQKRAGSTRLALMAIHFTLLALILLLSVFLNGDFLLLIIHCASLLAFLIYIPAAFILALKNSKSYFTHAGGEVAYLVVQAVIWTVAAALVLLFRLLVGECRLVDLDDDDNLVNSYFDHRYCDSMSAVVALSLIHMILLWGWMGWIVHTALRVRALTGTKAYDIPTGLLLSGEYQAVAVAEPSTRHAGELEAALGNTARGERIGVGRPGGSAADRAYAVGTHQLGKV